MPIRFQNHKFDDNYISIGRLVDCKESLQKRFYGLFNKNNMSALGNYLLDNDKYVHKVQFEPLESDLFDNAVVNITLKNKKDIFLPIYKEFPLNINIDTKENYVKSIRNIYNTIANAITEHKKN